MKKKTIISKNPSFIQSINIAKDWCKDWDDDLLSDEVFADRIKELLKTKSGIQAFRIQIAFASTKNEINTMKLNFMKKFPNVPIYLSYSTPYYKLRVGNFRTKFEAEKSKSKLIKNYPGSYIVSEYIKLNLLN